MEKQTEFDRLDKCASMLALPVWTISPDKGRAIEPKDQSVRNGRVLTYTARTIAWIPTKSTITARGPFCYSREQRWGSEFMAGINLRDRISLWISNWGDRRFGLLNWKGFSLLIIHIVTDNFCKKTSSCNSAIFLSKIIQFWHRVSRNNVVWKMPD